MRSAESTDMFSMSQAVLSAVEVEPQLETSALPTIKDDGWGTDTDWNTIAAAHQIEKFENETLEEPEVTPLPKARKKWWKLNLVSSFTHKYPIHCILKSGSRASETRRIA